ncbi:NADPH-dependent FMN reductase [Rhodanobacter lindaniclasticus]
MRWPSWRRRNCNWWRSRSRTCRCTATTTTPTTRRWRARSSRAIADVDGILFVRPEYNRSIPGALKSDRLGQPAVGQNSFARKPSGIIGTSPGAIGTAVAQQNLRSVLCFCNSPLMNTMEAYIQFQPGLIDADGAVTNASTAEFLTNYMKELHIFIERVLTVLPRDA